MIIGHIEINNFRKYSSARFSFHPQFNVLIGNNASGKTTVLDALALLLNTYFQGGGIVTGGGNLKKEDARYISIEKESLSFLEPQTDVWLSGCADVSGVKIEWIRELGDRGGKAKALTALGNSERRLVKEGKSPNLPLLLYYGAGRLWEIHKDTKADKPGSQLEGYRYCLDPKSDQFAFRKWLKKLTLTEIQKGISIPALSAVKNAVISCIPGAKNLIFDINEDTILVELKKEGVVRFDDLSDGFRNMIAMIADITHRCSKLNPHLGEEVASLTKGIILIDELDLHLHPKWQRRVVPDLRKTFPNMQFITSTHSPFIIQSVGEGELIDLDKSKCIEDSIAEELTEGLASPAPKSEFADKSIEDIVEGVMDVDLPQRSHRLQQMYEAAKKYYAVLKNSENVSHETKEELKIELDKLSAPFSENVAYHAFLEMERLAAGLGTSRTQVEADEK